MSRKIAKYLSYVVSAGFFAVSLLFFFGDEIFSNLARMFGLNLSESAIAFLAVPVGCFGIFFLVALSFVLHFMQKSHRREDLQKLARQMGWTFAPKTELAFLKEFAAILGISAPHALTGASTNILTGQMQGRNLIVADQRYTTGSGKNSTTHEQTVLGIEVGNFQMPFFCLEPEDLLDRILDGFMRYDIDFPNRPLFSKRYVLYGQNETQIRQFFTDNLLAFYEQQPIFTTVGGGKYLVIYNRGALLEPHEIMARLNFIVNLADVFARR